MAHTTVWVRGRNGTGHGVYHTDKDCSRLGCIHEPIPKRLKLLEGHFEVCGECESGRPSNTEQDHSYHKALKEAES